ncbi:hypothetical protein BD309DRAFT_653079 [Dichomitus squalens]|uniref:Uncharacterized protein n=1 Tax=Dichomitus squalens TaxID=114155 RepID=A0A4Q9Q5W2_9APHY|nr:uncharacterized protein DICSQDRAFT_133551 [Dichomitus squalens LYAD-421 SS1]EJF64839.1 hypothetical protein DICSQDRAFT_133551 [Dichomitus squalens LYAD-421 SS1]TBU33425.1 hypothetical protein BD311DRAFT_435079 [Dichomitus squalens]TBU37147.1 hypothetical protein BD309DRAFT_653079 [Dichomitus squalens]TBU62817.1 hypothetical protein BD310DRAFT_704248 [Dichomitus squalens]
MAVSMQLRCLPRPDGRYLNRQARTRPTGYTAHAYGLRATRRAQPIAILASCGNP